MGLGNVRLGFAASPLACVSAPGLCVWQSVKCHLSNALCVTVCRSSHHDFPDPRLMSECHRNAGEFVKISWKRKDGSGPEEGSVLWLIYESISLTAWPCINIIIKWEFRQGTVSARTSQSSLANRACCVYCVFALWSIQFGTNSLPFPKTIAGNIVAHAEHWEKYHAWTKLKTIQIFKYIPTNRNWFIFSAGRCCKECFVEN